jgi:hypothetical protein
MGELFDRFKFKVLPNPFGTVFNPLSLHQLIKYALNNTPVRITDLDQHGEIWSHYDFHTSFSGTDPDLVATHINEAIRQTHSFIKDCDVIMLTYGTSYVYSLQKDQRIVSNCHKHPSKIFSRRLLTIDEIIRDFSDIHEQLPDKQFIITVSPVRHTKDSLPLNQVSKSILRVATHDLSEKYENVNYFPSYEIMMDDLRDYRFYENDMIHPSTVAEEYIWSKFGEAHFSYETRQLLNRIQKILQKLAHRPQQPNTRTYKDFLNNLLSDLQQLPESIDFSTEKGNITRQLNQWPS